MERLVVARALKDRDVRNVLSDFVDEKKLTSETSCRRERFKEDSFLSSSLSMAMRVQSHTFGGGRFSSSSTADSSSQADPSGYQSPLFQRSSSNKSSTSPGRGGVSQRFKGGRGRAPSSKSLQGFRKWVSYPCPALTGGCLLLHWQAWRDRGAEPWVVEVLRFGYRLPFLRVPPLSKEPILHGFLFPSCHRGDRSGGSNSLSCRDRAGRTSSSSSSGLLQPDVHRSEDLRVVEFSGGPLGLQPLCFKTPFKMGAVQSVLLSVRQGVWLVSIDLKEAYLQGPIHPDSRKYLQLWPLASLASSGSLLRPLHGSPGLLQGYD